MSKREPPKNGDIREADIPLRNPSVRACPAGGDAILHDAERDQVFAVTALAREMWEQCDGHTSLAEIGRDIREQRAEDRPLSEIGEALRQAASRLSDHGLLFVLAGGLRPNTSCAAPGSFALSTARWTARFAA